MTACSQILRYRPQSRHDEGPKIYAGHPADFKLWRLDVEFVASNPNRLPGSNVGKLSVQFLIASIEKLTEKVESQQTSIAALEEQIRTLNNKNNGKNNNKR